MSKISLITGYSRLYMVVFFVTENVEKNLKMNVDLGRNEDVCEDSDIEDDRVLSSLNSSSSNFRHNRHLLCLYLNFAQAQANAI